MSDTQKQPEQPQEVEEKPVDEVKDEDLEQVAGGRIPDPGDPIFEPFPGPGPTFPPPPTTF